MAGGKEIRTKIKSVQNTQKITSAMEMVAASKMRKAQDRMRAARPFGEKVRRIAAHLSKASSEYRHPFLQSRPIKRSGLIIVTSDKGLCGGLNTNVLRMALNRLKEWSSNHIEADVTTLGGKGFSFMHRMHANIVSEVSQLGDTPHLEALIGPVKVMLDSYREGRIDSLWLTYNRFVNTMKQEPVIEQILPLSGNASDAQPGQWDYIYEPDAKVIIDHVLSRYIEALIYQAVSENMASEQSSRMVAMKSASENAGNVIQELQLIYNKTRQAAITKELSEIVAGAAAV
ncbi:MAG: F0F1 ATP synthase subunit gamma [Proteobacteria bacterium]|nr:F0F1 ATP synthase subunit gamma [Pseudomonadota bacterium]